MVHWFEICVPIINEKYLFLAKLINWEVARLVKIKGLLGMVYCCAKDFQVLEKIVRLIFPDLFFSSFQTVLNHINYLLPLIGFLGKGAAKFNGILIDILMTGKALSNKRLIDFFAKDGTLYQNKFVSINDKNYFNIKIGSLFSIGNIPIVAFSVKNGKLLYVLAGSSKIETTGVVSGSLYVLRYICNSEGRFEKLEISFGFASAFDTPWRTWTKKKLYINARLSSYNKK